MFDWKNPEYIPVWQERLDRLAFIREDPAKRLPPLRAYYREHPADFINDWGVTFDPRNLDIKQPSAVPFLLFPKQREWIDWTLERWQNRQPGLTEKSRDCGASWLSIGLACTLCLFHEGLALGFGSRKEEYVDKLDAPKSLFYKGRMFLKHLPPEFTNGWDAKRDAPHMRINFPATRSSIGGEAGDGIGRGDRAAIYFVDESAFLERPKLVEASLSQTTNCRIDISSANGMANPFAEKIHAGKISKFRFHWRDDPRKDQAWYDKQVEELDAVTIAQELDINYSASVEGVVIPSAWVQSAIDAHLKLGLTITGKRSGSLDVADEGKDKNAFCISRSILVLDVREWSGKGSDIYQTTEAAFDLADEFGLEGFRFDSDGLGAGVRGDANQINKQRKAKGLRELTVEPYRGSGAVINPESEDEPGRKNEDYFPIRKSQAWFSLRRRFMRTHRLVTMGVECDPDDIISLSSTMPLLGQLTAELSQVLYKRNETTGKMHIIKAPDDTKSPNLADAVVIQYSGGSRAPMVISDDALRAMQGARR